MKTQSEYTVTLTFLIDGTIRELGSQAGTGEFHDGELRNLVMPNTTYTMDSGAASEDGSGGGRTMTYIGVTSF